MMLPLVVGVGVTNGIHILNRFAEEQNPGILARSTGKAVLLSALTTVAGFGSLIPAQHQGIASLGQVMAFGTAACMIAGLTFLPTLLGWCTRRGWDVVRPLYRTEPQPEPNSPELPGRSGERSGVRPFRGRGKGSHLYNQQLARRQRGNWPGECRM
jgi:uncharacterized membrane protein YdfJ with MMPL/SSD domain